MKKQVFDSLEEVFEAFGEDGVIPITYMPQIIFYLSNYKIQPVWTIPSETNEGKLAFYFIKAETKKPYEAWIQSFNVRDNRVIEFPTLRRFGFILSR